MFLILSLYMPYGTWCILNKLWKSAKLWFMIINMMELLLFCQTIYRTHSKILVPGLRDPAGGPYNSEDTTGWGFIHQRFLPTAYHSCYICLLRWIRGLLGFTKTDTAQYRMCAIGGIYNGPNDVFCFWNTITSHYHPHAKLQYIWTCVSGLDDRRNTFVLHLITIIKSEVWFSSILMFLGFASVVIVLSYAVIKNCLKPLDLYNDCRVY